MAHREKHRLAAQGIYLDEAYGSKPTPKRVQTRRRPSPTWPHERRGRRLSEDVIADRRRRNVIAKRSRRINRPRRKRNGTMAAAAWLAAFCLLMAHSIAGSIPAQAAVIGAPLQVTQTWIGGNCWERGGTKPHDDEPHTLAPFFVPGCVDTSVTSQFVRPGDYFGADPDIGDAFAVSCTVLNTANGRTVATDYARKNNGHDATCLGRWS